MDLRAVLVALCMLIAQAACRSLGERKTAAVNATIQDIREEIGSALNELNEPGLLPDISCVSLNLTEQLGLRLEQRPLTADHLASVRCCLLQMSQLTPDLSDRLKAAGQLAVDAERLWRGARPAEDADAGARCSLPRSEDMDNHVYVRCLLQLLDSTLSTAKF